jgi:hypothetical protein
MALQPADKVIVLHDYGNKRAVGTVTRLTKTRLLVRWLGRETAFRRQDGDEVGGVTLGRVRLMPATPELIAQVVEERRRAHMIRQIQNTPWSKVTSATLNAVYAALAADENVLHIPEQ